MKELMLLLLLVVVETAVPDAWKTSHIRKIGEELKIDCPTDPHNPSIKFEWEKYEDIKLEANKTLYIKSVGLGHSGNYFCFNYMRGDRWDIFVQKKTQVLVISSYCYASWISSESEICKVVYGEKYEDKVDIRKLCQPKHGKNATVIERKSFKLDRSTITTIIFIRSQERSCLYTLMFKDSSIVLWPLQSSRDSGSDNQVFKCDSIRKTITSIFLVVVMFVLSIFLTCFIKTWKANCPEKKWTESRYAPDVLDQQHETYVAMSPSNGLSYEVEKKY